MMQEYLDMIESATMPLSYNVEDSTIQFGGGEVEVSIVTVSVNANGDTVEAIFHKGTDTLVDMNVKHNCTCGHCKH